MWAEGQGGCRKPEKAKGTRAWKATGTESQDQGTCGLPSPARTSPRQSEACAPGSRGTRGHAPLLPAASPVLSGLRSPKPRILVRGKRKVPSRVASCRVPAWPIWGFCSFLDSSLKVTHRTAIDYDQKREIRQRLSSVLWVKSRTGTIMKMTLHEQWQAMEPQDKLFSGAVPTSGHRVLLHAYTEGSGGRENAQHG